MGGIEEGGVKGEVEGEGRIREKRVWRGEGRGEGSREGRREKGGKGEGREGRTVGGEKGVSSALFIAVTLLYKRHHGYSSRIILSGDGYNNAIIWYIDVNPSIS